MNVSKWNEPSKFLIWSMIDCFSLGARPLTCKIAKTSELKTRDLMEYLQMLHLFLRQDD